MTDRTKLAARASLMTGIAVAALVVAPSATATSRGPNCREAGVKTICQTNGSVSIKARPGTTAPPANLPVFPWLGMPGAR